jgi:hypothetical protein
MGGYSPISGALLYGPGSALTELLPAQQAVSWGPGAEGPIHIDLAANCLRGLKPDENLSWARGAYRLKVLNVIRPEEGADEDHRRFELLALSSAAPDTDRSQRPTFTFHIGNQPPPNDGMFRGGFNTEIPVALYVPLPDRYTENSVFEARPGQTNVWAISLWDELVAAVRASLKGRKE